MLSASTTWCEESHEAQLVGPDEQPAGAVIEITLSGKRGQRSPGRVGA
jgi:hypothetical protein